MPSRSPQGHKGRDGGIHGCIHQSFPAVTQEARGNIIIGGSIHQALPPARIAVDAVVFAALDRIKAGYDFRHPNLFALSILIVISLMLPFVLLLVAPGLDTALGLLASAIALACGFFAFPVVIKGKK